MINACVSHEMRNPINSILSMNAKLQDNSKDIQKILMDGGITDEQLAQISRISKEMSENIRI
jgi:signal transduction histidine kinase